MTDEAAGDTDTTAEIAEIEGVMRSDYRTYARDPAMQARYLSALKAREPASAAEPREASAVDTEIAQIQERMRTDTRGYDRDPEMQARYLELLGEQQRERAKPLAFAPKHGHFHPPEAEKAAAKQSTAPVEPAGDGHATARPTADIIADLETEPETAALLKTYGAQAPESIGDAAREATRLLNAMSPEAAEAVSAAYDGMSGAERARVLAQLADSGRAMRTR